MDSLKALRQVDFNWVVKTDDIWKKSPFDIPEINGKIRKDLIDEIESYSESGTSPLGWVIVGAGGSGKTHLLREVRQDMAEKRRGFLMVDLTGVNDFWETTLLQCIDSLRKPFVGEIPQYQLILEHIINMLRKHNDGRTWVRKLAGLDQKKLISGIKKIINVLSKRYRIQLQKHHDVIRALILLNSDDFSLSNLGFSWLQGLGIDPSEKREFGFAVERKKTRDIVEALCWVMSLRGPFLLVFDQMDSIVMEHHLIAESKSPASADLSEEQQKSKSIIEGLAGGLSALVQTIGGSNARIVVSCLETTWNILVKTVSTNADRFYTAKMLKNIENKQSAEQLVQQRLCLAYEKAGFKPPYATFPFKPEAFRNAKRLFTREILKHCDDHRKRCIKNQAISELDSFKMEQVGIGNGPDTKLINSFNEKLSWLKAKASRDEILDENNEDTILGEMQKTAFKLILTENETPSDVDASVNLDIGGGKSYPFLHARARLVYRQRGELEDHLCIRAISRKNATAFQARLKAALTSSGIDKNLRFRRLLIVRNPQVPGGAKTKELCSRFTDAGGLFVKPEEDELKTLFALHQLAQTNPPGFNTWLRHCRPVSNLPMFTDSVKWFFRDCQPSDKTETKTDEDNAGESQKKDQDSTDSKTSVTDNEKKENEEQKAIRVSSTTESLPVGKRLIGDETHETVSIPIPALRKHTVILAGAGSGKTVLVRRIVEEAALLGVPSIVIDCANDLSRMGKPWPEPPSAWSGTDGIKAPQYHGRADVVIWTPGIGKGNPLSFSPLPDLQDVADDTDELNQMIDMTMGSFTDIVAPGKSEKSKKKKGILASALRYFSKGQKSGLSNFLVLLDDLPAEGSGGITGADKLAREMSDQIKAELSVNVMLRQDSTEVDPSVLLGLNHEQRNVEKTRISVINFSGLPELSSQQQFVNQLAMLLFTWIKKKPPRDNKPLTGLLVIDEAKDFVSSSGWSPSRDSLIRLAAQARKYGLGLIFATQAPKSIDHNIIANCMNQFYGQASSPAAINAIQDQLKQRGGSGRDIAVLGTGKFYISMEGLRAPLKIKTPLCLSYHPDNPPDQIEVLKLANESKNTCQCLGTV